MDGFFAHRLVVAIEVAVEWSVVFGEGAFEGGEGLGDSLGGDVWGSKGGLEEWLVVCLFENGREFVQVHIHFIVGSERDERLFFEIVASSVPEEDFGVADVGERGGVAADGGAEVSGGEGSYVSEPLVRNVAPGAGSGTGFAHFAFVKEFLSEVGFGGGVGIIGGERNWGWGSERRRWFFGEGRVLEGDSAAENSC